MNVHRSSAGFAALLCAALLAPLVGCVSGDTPSEKFHSRMRADAVPPSDFLPHHERLVRQPNHFPFHYFYLKNDTKAYKYVYIAPVSTDKLRESSAWGEFDKKMMGQLGFKVNDLAVFMRKAYQEAFRKAAQQGNRLELTDRTDLPGTLVIEPALIALAPTKTELNALGVAASFFVLGASVATSMVSAGSITVECRVKDAKSGEIVAMYADTENDPKALLAVSQFTYSSSMRINIKEIAAQTAAVLSAKNPSEIRRKFPVQFISKISDGDLDEDKK